MTFKEIYNQTIEFWPSEIDISDGTMVDSDSGNFPILTELWDKAEIQTKSKSDFIKLMVWGIFCAFHKKAIENTHNGKTKVLLTELNINYLKNRFEESLFDPEYDYYKKLRTEYKSV